MTPLVWTKERLAAASDERLIILCKWCKEKKPASSFYTRFNSLGVPYKESRCKACYSLRTRKYQMNPIQYERHRWAGLLKRDQEKGFSSGSFEDYLSVVAVRKCHYCGIAKDIGADRIDNARGHTKDNMLPCCWTCNRTRSDIFTVEEMMLEIGPAIARVNAKRVSSPQASVVQDFEEK